MRLILVEVATPRNRTGQIPYIEGPPEGRPRPGPERAPDANRSRRRLHWLVGCANMVGYDGYDYYGETVWHNHRMATIGQ
jgi:hypothetical protein